MAEDRYRLAPLREVRERSEVTQRGALSSAIGDARTTEAVLAAAAARVEQARIALHGGAAARAATASQLLVGDRYRSRLRGALAAALDEQLRAQLAHEARTGEVEAARARLARARADRELIERHFAAWRTEQKKRADARDEVP